MSATTSKANSGTSDWGITAPPKFPAGTKVYVLPGAFYGNVVSLMASAGLSKASSLEDCDILVFTGGADINPSLYNQRAAYTYGISQTRDDLEKSAYERAKRLNKVCFGICRGAQFLAALNGASLWQDVNNHGGNSHWIIDIEEDVRVHATSIHHQMIQPHDDMTIVAVTEEQVATRFRDANIDTDLSRDTSGESMILEIEAGAYPKTKTFFVQGHPEVGCDEYRSWCLTKLHDFYMDWTEEKQKEGILQTMPSITVTPETN